MRSTQALEGLEFKVAPESPSAALLQPLRMGDWHPPAEPAPVAHLAPASLEHRLKGFGDSEQEPAPVGTPTTATAAPQPPSRRTGVRVGDRVRVSEPVTNPADPHLQVRAVPVPPVAARVEAPPNDRAERLANLPDVLPSPGTDAASAPLRQSSPRRLRASLEFSLPEVVVSEATTPLVEKMQAESMSSETATKPVPAT